MSLFCSRDSKDVELERREKKGPDMSLFNDVHPFLSDNCVPDPSNAKINQFLFYIAEVTLDEF